MTTLQIESAYLIELATLELIGSSFAGASRFSLAALQQIHRSRHPLGAAHR